jgi:2-polyprenyl-3-methyl-5-hydroxy-6-metoxy-1,4-benzoquinol methylase
VPDGDKPADPTAEELSELVREIRERVRGRRPGSEGGNLVLPDLLPVLHARDVAESKVAAIGTLNPRPPGALNTLIQFAKFLTARMLDWHIREQVEFNRATVDAIGAVLEALNENNRALGVLAEAEADHIRLLRTVADLHGDFKQRTARMETQFRELVQSQHGEFTAALDRSGIEIQQRLWSDLEKMQAEYERLIHAELRVLRQRAAARPQPPAPAPAPAVGELAPAIDFLWFAERFRGSEEYVRGKQRFYVPFFQGRTAVADLGCGRGEFLELMREAGAGARGIDASEECVALCRSKGLDAERADAFDYLAGLGGPVLDGIFCAQMVEHLPPARVPELIRLASASLASGAVLAIETPNPECLAALAKHFYLDPTHERPVPAALLRFYMEECGFGGIEIHYLSPAVEPMTALATLPEDFRAEFFGGLDCAVIGRKL